MYLLMKTLYTKYFVKNKNGKKTPHIFMMFAELLVSVGTGT